MIGIYDLDKCSDLDYKTRINIYKNTGFNEIALYIDNNYINTNENYEDIINYAVSLGIQVNQAHVDYKISNLICDKTTNEYFNYIQNKLDVCKQFKIKYLVAHASMGNNPPELDEEDLKKLSCLLDKFKQDNIYLCLENVRVNKNLDKALLLNHPNLKVCFDLGHAHCYDNEYELFEKYKYKIICSHLHNNFKSDTHNILTQGEIDYKFFIKKLLKIKDSSNCLECFPPYGEKLSKQQFIKFVKDCYESINDL